MAGTSSFEGASEADNVITLQQETGKENEGLCEGSAETDNELEPITLCQEREAQRGFLMDEKTIIVGGENRKLDLATDLDLAVANTDLFGCREIIVSSDSISTPESGFSSVLDANINSTKAWWKRHLSLLQTGGGHVHTSLSLIYANLRELQILK